VPDSRFSVQLVKHSWWKVETAPAVRLLKRRVRQLLRKEAWHFTDVRHDVEMFGTWAVVSSALGPDSIVYSVGVGTEIDFDVALIERFGLQVHAFDPTPVAVEWITEQRLPAGFVFHPLGVAAHDGTAEFAARSTVTHYTSVPGNDAGAARVSRPVRRLHTLSASLGHERIDLLKLDVEGAEYAVLHDTLRRAIFPEQILVEFHHRFATIGKHRTEEAVAALRNAGYQIVYISPSGREYGFIRQG
jgi:FkbM family methyltransferase